MSPRPRPIPTPGSNPAPVRAMLLAAGLAMTGGLAVLLAVEFPARGTDGVAGATAAESEAALWTPPADADAGRAVLPPDDNRLAAAVLAGLLRQGYRTP